MAIRVLSNNLTGKLLENIKANASKKLLVGVMNSDTATYAMYLEYGWVQRVTPKQNAWLNAQLGTNYKFSTLSNPPRPFMRATFAQKNKEWAELFKAQLIRTQNVKTAFETLGTVVVADIQKTINEGGCPAGSFPKRSPLTMAMFEALGENQKVRKIQRGGALPNNTTTTQPMKLSGKLLASISMKVI